MPEAVKISFTIPDADKFEAVLKAARKIGFEKESAFPRLGVASGTIKESALEKLRALDGVGSVELQRTYRAV